MPSHSSRMRAIWLTAALTLSACAMTENSPPPKSERQETAIRDFQSHGFMDTDITAIALYIASDFPKSPALPQGPETANVLLKEHNVRLLDRQVILDTHAFVRRLLTELQRQSGQKVSYSGRRELDPGANDTSRGGRGGRGGTRRGLSTGTQGNSSVEYQMEVAVNRSHPGDSGYPDAQRYVFTIRESASEKAIWEGSFFIDAPAEPPSTPPSK